MAPDDRRCRDVIIQAMTGHQSCLGVRLMSVVSCHYMSHSISQYYGPHRETNLNIITGRQTSACCPPYFLIIPPGLQSAVYSVATTGQALSTSHLLVQICTSNYHLLAPLNTPASSTGFPGRKSAQLQIESETEEMIGGQGGEF